MKILYFAWLRQRIGKGEEDLSPPADIVTVDQLTDWLAGLSDKHAEAFADRSLIRVAVNQDYVDGAHAVKAGDEIAFFPPVTGG